MIDVDYNEYKKTIAENMKLIVENHKLQKRIDKAIEYIKLKWSYEKLDEVGRNDAIGETGETIYEDILREEDTKNVLAILKGEDKE